MVLTLGGARVLLIDGDMRRPSVHTAFGTRIGLGLSNVLAGQTSLRQAIHPTADPKLYIMPAGHLPPNPAELLGSAEMVELLHRLVNQPAECHTEAAGGQSGDISDLGSFDWVIIDTPPVLAVTDAVTLMPNVSGLVFVLGAEMTSLGAAQRALDLLTAPGRPTWAWCSTASTSIGTSTTTTDTTGTSSSTTTARRRRACRESSGSTWPPRRKSEVSVCRLWPGGWPWRPVPAHS